jgi:hypothetical protein
VNQSSGNTTTQTSTPSPTSTLPPKTTTSDAPTTTTTTTTVAPDSAIDIEDFINTSREDVATLTNEANIKDGAALIINGKPVPVTVKTTTTSTTMSYGNASLEVTCFAVDGSPIALSTDGRFTLQRGDLVSMTATGFAPVSNINVAIFSDPIALGTATTNKSGQATQQWNIPDSMEPGDHTLVFSGDLANIENTVFGLRIVVNQESFITRITSSMWTRVILALGIAGGLVVPANRRRRRRTV